MGIWASGDRVVPAKLNIGQPYGISGPAAVDSTTSATYVNMASASFSFTKLLASTRIRVVMHVGWWTNNAASGPKWGVRIGSTDYDLAQMGATTPAAGVHSFAAGGSWISGVAAGTYTIQGRWLRIAGAGTLNRDTGDWLFFEATEVA